MGATRYNPYYDQNAPLHNELEVLLEQRSVILKAQQVGKTVVTPEGPLTLLQGIDLAIEDAQSVAIVGRSGSGKSTLMGLLAGLDSPTEGTIELAGQSLTELTEDERARLRASLVGFVFQSFQLLPGLTALENVMLPMELREQQGVRQLAMDYLQAVDLSARVHHYPSQLSGGEQQRVALARAFASQPKVLFADEPTANLDRQTGNRISELLFQMNQQQGTTLVLVTHDDQLAAQCQRQFQMDAGRLSEVSRSVTSVGHLSEVKL